MRTGAALVTFIVRFTHDERPCRQAPYALVLTVVGLVRLATLIKYSQLFDEVVALLVGAKHGSQKIGG